MRRLPKPEEYLPRDETFVHSLRIPQQQRRSAQVYYAFRQEEGLKLSAAYGPNEDDVQLYYFTDFSPVRAKRLSHDEGRWLVSLQTYIARTLLLLAALVVAAAWIWGEMSYWMLALVAVAALGVTWAIALAAVPLAQRWYVSRLPFGSPPEDFAAAIATVEKALVEEDSKKQSGRN
jgi:hypothetical protein